jgi:tetratricopeptide (TPR) repeat protein
MRGARGEYARAIDLLSRARALRVRQFGPRDLESARMRHEIATLTASFRGTTAARPLLDTALAELRGLLGDAHDEVKTATSELMIATDDSVAAGALLARLTQLERRSPSRDPIAMAERLNDRASQRFGESRFTEAAALFQASLDLLRRQRPPTDGDVRTVQRNLALALVNTRELARAESLQRADLALEDRIHGGADTRAMANEALALTFAAEKRADSAEVREREALRLFRAGLAPGHDRIASALRNLAFIVSARGRPAEGLALLDSAIALRRAGPDSLTSGGYLTAQRAPFLLRLGRIDEAARSVAAAEERLGASPAVTATHRADVQRYAGMVLLARGDAPGAAARFRAAAALVGTRTEAATATAANDCLLGVALAAEGRAEEARPLLGAPCERYTSRGLLDSLLVEWIRRARRSVDDRVGAGAPPHASSPRKNSQSWTADPTDPRDPPDPLSKHEESF